MGAIEPLIFSVTEGLDIGCEISTAVLDTPPESTIFNGEIKWVELAMGEDNFSQLVKPEDLMHMLLSRQ